MQKCFTSNNEKPSLRLPDKKAKEQRAEGRWIGTTGRRQQMLQLKIISTILKFIWRKQKRKQNTAKQKKSKEKKTRGRSKADLHFKAHAKKKKENKKKKKSVSLNKETAEKGRNL